MKIITKQIIIETCLHLADTEGYSALTMRKLAGQLNIEAASLYYHVKNKDSLYQLISDTIATRSLVSAVPDANLQQQIKNIAISYRAVLVAHPGIIPVVVACPPSFHVIMSSKNNNVLPTQEAMLLLGTALIFTAGHALAQSKNSYKRVTSETENTTYYDDWFQSSLERLISSNTIR